MDKDGYVHSKNSGWTTASVKVWKFADNSAFFFFFLMKFLLLLVLLL